MQIKKSRIVENNVNCMNSRRRMGAESTRAYRLFRTSFPDWLSAASVYRTAELQASDAGLIGLKTERGEKNGTC